MQKLKENTMHMVFFLCAITSIIAVLLICLFLFVNGFPAMAEIGIFNFLFGQEWTPSDTPASFGILPMILGSIYVTLGATLIGCPIGILTAVFLSSFCPEKLYTVLKSAVSLLAGIPSIIYGFFGLVLIVPLVRNVFGGNGSSILTASLVLGIMILPTIIMVSEAALKAVPSNYYEGGIALGSSHEHSIFFIVLPAAKSGILASVVLGIGRAIGETMAVVMIAGNQARMPDSVLKGVRTMTSNIILEMGYATDLHRGALIATAIVLFMFILIINLALHALKRRSKF